MTIVALMCAVAFQVSAQTADIEKLLKDDGDARMQLLSDEAYNQVLAKYREFRAANK